MLRYTTFEAHVYAKIIVQIRHIVIVVCSFFEGFYVVSLYVVAAYVVAAYVDTSM